MNFASVLIFFSHVVWDRMASGDGSGCPSPGPVRPKQARLQLAIASSTGRPLKRDRELLGISERSLSSPPVVSRGGVFSDIYRGNLVELLVVSPTIWNQYPMMVPLMS